MTHLAIDRSEIDDRWVGYQGLFGGFVAGLLVDAAMSQSTYRMVSMSMNFVSGVAIGDVSIEIQQLHQGRSTQLSRLTLRQDDRACIYGSAEFVQGATEYRDLPPLWTQSEADTELPTDWLDQGRYTLPFDDLFEVRRTDRPRVSERSATWVRVHPDVGTPPGLQSAEALLAVFLDLPTPGLFGEPDPPAFIPTIDYTLHFPPRAEWQPSGWIRIVHSTAWATHSDCADDVQAWDEAGNLVALARQTRSVRWPRANDASTQ